MFDEEKVNGTFQQQTEFSSSESAEGFLSTTENILQKTFGLQKLLTAHYCCFCSAAYLSCIYRIHKCQLLPCIFSCPHEALGDILSARSAG